MTWLSILYTLLLTLVVSDDDDDDDDNNSVSSTGVHPYPGQRVECVQALHRVQGAPQPPEVAVPTSGHLQLPPQESHREQGELQVAHTQFFSLTSFITKRLFWIA